MKKPLIVFAAVTALIFTSCVKEPTACIDTFPDEVEVFENVTFSSECSENAESYSWDVENDALGFFFGSASKTGTGSTISNSWDYAGDYYVTLEVASKKDKYTDVITKEITVVDVCYECEYTSGSYTYDLDLCASNYISMQEFMLEIDEYESNDYTCKKLD